VFPVNSHTFWQEVVRPHPVAIGTLVLYQDIQDIPDQVELHTESLQQAQAVHPYVWAYRCGVEAHVPLLLLTLYASFFVASGDGGRDVEGSQLLARGNRPLDLLKSRHIGLVRRF
jgi:hypothetical protein